MKIGFIGAGNMAEALIKGLKGENILASDVRKSRLSYLKKKYRVKTTGSNKELVRQADIIILAVKPQNIKAVLKEVSGRTRCSVLGRTHGCVGRTHGWAPTQGKLIISIVAGITIRLIEKSLGGKTAVVRVMPNTPALVGSGISALAKGRYASRANLKQAERIFSSVGEVVILPEKKLDAVTAVSGSGPAYFFYLIESLIEAGIKLGLEKEAARKLAIETSLGAGRLIKETGIPASELRRRVTSKKGTTEAALKVFSRRKLNQIIKQGVLAAAQRSKEISRKLCL